MKKFPVSQFKTLVVNLTLYSTLKTELLTQMTFYGLGFPYVLKVEHISGPIKLMKLQKFLEQ